MLPRQALVPFSLLPQPSQTNSTMAWQQMPT